MNIQNLWDRAGLALCLAQSRLLAQQEQYAAFPRQRRLMSMSAAVVCGGLLFATSASAQQSDGLAGMVTTAGNQADTAKLALGKIFAALGFGVAGTGGWNWYRKGKEGDQSHIKGQQIIVPIAAGAALGAIGFVMIKAGESMGIQRSDLGVVPN